MLGAKVIVTAPKRQGHGHGAQGRWRPPRTAGSSATSSRTRRLEVPRGDDRPEIIGDFKASGKKLTHWVTGYGTGGTFHLCGARGKSKIDALEDSRPST